MPSRRNVIRTVAASATLMSGCSRTKNGGDTISNTTTELPETSQITSKKTAAETRPQPECNGKWESNPSWEFGEGKDIDSVVAGEEFAYALFGESVTALDLETGEEMWRTTIEGVGKLGSRISSFQRGGRVIISGSRGIAAIEPESGETDWTFTIPGKRETARLQDIASHNEVIYIAAINGDTPSFEASDPYVRIYSLDITTGEPEILVELSTESDPPNFGHLLSNDSGVYVIFGDHLLSFDPDGQEYWRSGITWTSTPALEGEILVVPSRNSLVAIDANSGEEIWTNKHARRAVTINDGTTYAPVRSGDEDRVAAINVGDGTIIWETATVGLGERPIVHNSIVYIHIGRTEKSDYLSAFDSRSGCEIGNIEFESQPIQTFDVGIEHVFTVLDVAHGDLQAFTAPRVEA